MGEHDGEWRGPVSGAEHPAGPTANPIADAIRKAKPPKTGKPSKPAQLGLYIEHEGGFRRVSGKATMTLCNFTAKITEEVLIDDGGEEPRLTFIISGRLNNGNALPPIEVAASGFASMAWVNSSIWGSKPYVFAGTSTKDHVRAAIQSLSDPPRRTVYAHTGWRKIDGAWRYLHGGGALGADGNRADVEVNPGAGHMRNYRLPDPPHGEALQAAVRASLDLMSIAPGKTAIGALLLASIYRAPTASLHPIDHAAFLVGYTGSRKSELAALAMAHFGQGFNARSFPSNWTDTPGVMEQKAHAAADALIVIDDFKPTGTKADVDAMHKKAETIFRAAGNQAGRGRLSANLKQRGAFHPRGFILGTGEDLPRGQSLRARLTIAGISRDANDPNKGDVDLSLLTQLQGYARSGTLAAAMAGYLQWLAPQIDALKASLPETIRAERDRAAAAGLKGHSRAPSDYASLSAGINLFCRFVAECGALPPEEAEDAARHLNLALWGLLEDQNEHQAHQDDVTRFMALLASALNCGRCHVYDLTGSNQRGAPLRAVTARAFGWKQDKDGEWSAQGHKIGHARGEMVYLDGDAAFAAVAEYAKAQGGTIELTKQVLFTRLYERGLLPEVRRGKNGKLNLQTRLQIDGARAWAYAIRAAAITDIESPT